MHIMALVHACDTSTTLAYTFIYLLIIMCGNKKSALIHACPLELLVDLKMPNVKDRKYVLPIENRLFLLRLYDNSVI